MEMMIREAKCVELKRHGAEHVEKLISGLTIQQQLEFWQQRTESMMKRQKETEKNKA